MNQKKTFIPHCYCYWVGGRSQLLYFQHMIFADHWLVSRWTSGVCSPPSKPCTSWTGPGNRPFTWNNQQKICGFFPQKRGQFPVLSSSPWWQEWYLWIPKIITHQTKNVLKETSCQHVLCTEKNHSWNIVILYHELWWFTFLDNSKCSLICCIFKTFPYIRST